MFDLFIQYTTWLGAEVLRLLSFMGGIFLFMLEALYRGIAPKQFYKTLRQLNAIGAQSLFVIILVAVFTGMVLGLQGYYMLVRFGADGLLGAAVALALIQELGPVLTAIMITARAGSAMAAEIGVMRITDQVDALAVMDIHPVAYLVSPRIWASLVAFPLLTAIFDVVGILGGYITGVVMLGMNSGTYFFRIDSNVAWSDVSGGFAKSFVFSLIVTTVCCYQGYYAHKRRDGVGPEAVSRATTSAVVLSCVLILVADYVLTSFLL